MNDMKSSAEQIDFTNLRSMIPDFEKEVRLKKSNNENISLESQTNNDINNLNDIEKVIKDEKQKIENFNKIPKFLQENNQFNCKQENSETIHNQENFGVENLKYENESNENIGFERKKPVLSNENMIKFSGIYKHFSPQQNYGFLNVNNNIPIKTQEQPVIFNETNMNESDDSIKTTDLFKKNIVNFFIMLLQEYDLSVVSNSWLRKRMHLDNELFTNTHSRISKDFNTNTIQNDPKKIQLNFNLNESEKSEIKNPIPAENINDVKSKTNSDVESNLEENGCPHKNLKHYAKNMCSNCYRKKGRMKKAWLCAHTGKAHYALGKCQNCYFSTYQKAQRRKKNVDLPNNNI